MSEKQYVNGYELELVRPTKSSAILMVEELEEESSGLFGIVKAIPTESTADRKPITFCFALLEQKRVVGFLKDEATGSASALFFDDKHRTSDNERALSEAAIAMLLKLDLATEGVSKIKPDEANQLLGVTPESIHRRDAEIGKGSDNGRQLLSSGRRLPIQEIVISYKNDEIRGPVEGNTSLVLQVPTIFRLSGGILSSNLVRGQGDLKGQRGEFIKKDVK